MEMFCDFTSHCERPQGARQSRATSAQSLWVAASAAPPRNDGFTLVELSIVLVILGLLIGGVLAGQNLIRAAELRSVITEFNQFQTAVMTFKEKYFALPGDMDNATAFWGTDPDGCATHTNRVAKTETCDGDGSGGIGNIGGNNENYRLWQHLSNAGLIEGSFTGVAGSGDPEHVVPGENSPQLSLSGAGVALRYVGYQDNSYYFPAMYNNFYIIGGILPDDIPADRIFMAEEAWGIDKKIDDGRVGTGKMFGPRAPSRCSTNTDPALAEYALDTTEPGCVLIIRSGF